MDRSVGITFCVCASPHQHRATCGFLKAMFIEPNASYNRQNISDLPHTPNGYEWGDQILATSVETHRETIGIDRSTGDE